MADDLAYIGEMSIGACIPGPVLALSVAVPGLEAQISALASFSPLPVVSFSADITTALGIVAGLQTSIALGLTPPNISAQLAIVLAQLAALRAQLDVIVGITNLFASAGVHAYAYDGTASGFGATVSAALASGFPGGSGGSQHCNALVLATTVGATWGAMQTVFHTT